MGVYSRTETSYDLTRQFRVNNGGKWNKKDDLIFWLRSNRDDNTLQDVSKNRASTTIAGTGHLNFRGSPDDLRFPISSLNFSNKYITVSAGQAADDSNKKSILIGGWIYLSVPPNTNNNGYPILHANSSTPSFTIFVDSNGRLNISLSDYNSPGGSIDSYTVRTVDTVVKEGVWVHFMVHLPTNAATKSTFKSNTTIFINGQPRDTQNPSNVGSASLDPKVAMTTYQIGYGPAEDDLVAGSSSGNVFFLGNLADIFMLQTEGNTIDLIPTIWSAISNGAKHLGSGFLSTSPFTVRDEQFNRSTHPTIARSSNDNRLGNNQIFFDDSRALHLGHSGRVNFPSMLTADSDLFNTVYASNDDGQLETAAANSTFGIFDEYYKENNETKLEPFIESKVYIDAGGAFYQTGTLDSVIPGFNTGLRNKQQIQITTDISTETVIGSTSITEHNTSRTVGPHFLQYLNFKDQKFEGPGFGVFPADSDADLNNANGVYQRYVFTRKNTLGFSPVGGQMITGFHDRASNDAPWSNGAVMVYNNSTDNLKFPLSGSKGFIENFGRPFEEFGFPGTDNYEPPDDGCLLKMSDFITEPFLLEKISVRFPFNTQFFTEDRLAIRQSAGSFPGGRGTTLYNEENDRKYQILAKQITAFLLRQSPPKQSFTYTADFSTATDTIPVQKVVSGNFREIIGYGQCTMLMEYNSHENFENDYVLATDHTGSQVYVNATAVANAGLAREQTLFFPTTVSTDTATSYQEVNAEADINFTPKHVFKSPFRGVLQAYAHIQGGSGIQQNIVLSWNRNASHLYKDTVEERRYTAAVHGTVPDKKLKTITTQTGQGTNDVTPFTFNSPPTNTEVVDSPTPYLLLPEDNLILGIQAPIDVRWADSTEIGANYIKIQPGQVQLTLYGSTLSSERPARVQFNQNLATANVHEAIGQATVADQWAVAQTIDLTGSYSDDVMSGSVDHTKIYEGYDAITDSTILLARRIGGRASAGTQGETGALQLNYKLTDNEERYLDSIMPNYGQTAVIDGFVGDGGGLFQEGGVTNVVLGQKTNGGTGNHVWPYAFPFEPRYATVQRNDSLTVPSTLNRGPLYKIEIDDDSSGVKSAQLVGDSGAHLTGSVIVPRNSDFSIADNSTGITQFINEKAALKLLFGIGDLSRGRYYARGTDAGGIAGNDTKESSSVANIAGFKYGVANSSAKFTSLSYRRGRYGQLRDMLEQRPFVAMRKNQTDEFPVAQRFFSRFGQPLADDARSQTTCSNISTNATSSIPFFDRENDSAPQNRDAAGSVSTINISPNFAPGQGPFSGLQ